MIYEYNSLLNNLQWRHYASGIAMAIWPGEVMIRYYLQILKIVRSSACRHRRTTDISFIFYLYNLIFILCYLYRQ